jgi:hypothetical protein
VANTKLDSTVCVVLYSCASGLSLILSIVPLLNLAAIPLHVLALVFWYIHLHRLWSAIPESSRSTSPGKAVGFLFIPCFNLYWVFRAYVSLVSDITRVSGSRGPEGLAISLAILHILSVLAFIPWVGSMFLIADYVVWLLFVLGVTKQANEMLEQLGTVRRNADVAVAQA